MPPIEKLVPPVHTETAFSPLIFTMNLLWEIYDFPFFRGVQNAPMPVFSSLGGGSEAGFAPPAQIPCWLKLWRGTR